MLLITTTNADIFKLFLIQHTERRLDMLCVFVDEVFIYYDMMIFW